MELVRGKTDRGGETSDDAAGDDADANGAATSVQPSPARCSTLVDVALLDADAGDLTDLRRAALKAHVRRCGHCLGALDEIRQARRELLGDSPTATTMVSSRAAAEIQRILSQRAPRGRGSAGALPAA